MEPPQALDDFKPAKDFFVGIDSDGCVFDTMEIKQKECFIPNVIKHWGLQAISKYVRQTHEFVNLYSAHRGANRWPALVKVFDLLQTRPEVRARMPELPDMRPLREFIESEGPHSNDSLRQRLERTGDPTLRRVLAWSEAVNAAIDEFVKAMPPFPRVRDCLEDLQSKADLIVVSGTPMEALGKEWADSGIASYVRLIVGQEMGGKADILKRTAAGRYPPDHMLVIGDAPGDLRAARAVGASFYPINPGDEEGSWQRFKDDACDRFLGGRYAGSYEAALIESFEARLPERPPWAADAKQGA